MRKLILILFLFSYASAQVANVLPAYSGKILQDGNTYLPATKTNARLQQYEAMKLGVIIDYNINTLIGDSTLFPQGYPLNDPKYYTSKNFNTYNIVQWVDSLATVPNLKYIVLTCSTYYGFLMWNSDIQWLNPSSYYTTSGWTNGFLCPNFYKYDLGVGLGLNNNYLDQFISECRKKNIEPIPYLQFADGLNWGGQRYASMNATVQPMYATWLCSTIQEMIIRYKIRYIWIDDYANVASSFMQKIYNAVKVASNSDCLVIADCTAGSEASTWPFDIASRELYSLRTKNLSYLSPYTSVSSTNYYIPKEIVTTVMSNEQYYYYSNGAPHPGSGMTYTLLSQTAMNNIYDTAYNNYSRMLFGIMPDAYGVLPTAQINLLKNLQ